MDGERKTAFISYSWDSGDHQQWVLNLMNRLRKNGVDATMDIMETQSGTKNLNTMMISSMKERDYIIVVLSENYAQKADKQQGELGLRPPCLYQS